MICYVLSTPLGQFLCEGHGGTRSAGERAGTGTPKSASNGEPDDGRASARVDATGIGIEAAWAGVGRMPGQGVRDGQVGTTRGQRRRAMGRGYGRSVGGPRWGFAQAVAIVPAGRCAGPCSLSAFTFTPHFTNFQRAAHGTPTSLSREPAKKRAMADPVHTALPRGAMQRGVSSLGTGAVEHQEKGRMLVQLTTLTLKVYQSDFPTLTL